jgi:hypothetical protein
MNYEAMRQRADSRRRGKRISVSLSLTYLASVAHAQSAVVDWTTVEVGTDGEASFGPRVRVPEPDPPDFMRLLGYFAHSGVFYGRPGFTEYQRLGRGEAGRLEAMKVVGDVNVPRGELTWRSPRGESDAPRWLFPIQLHLRDDVEDDGAFWWSPGHEHAIEFESYDAFSIVGQNPAGELRARFHRVSEEEALEASRTTEDAP